MNQKIIGEFIKTLRKEKGLTQEELSERLDISFKTVSKWENGRGMPRLSTLQELSEELDVTVNELLSGKRIESACDVKPFEKNIVDMIEYSNSKILKTVKLTYLVIIIFGLFLAISALSIFPSESSWGSVYSFIGVFIFSIGVGLMFKSVGKIKQLGIIIATLIFSISILLFSDYINVKEFNMPPRFRIATLTIGDYVAYETLFYNVYKINGVEKFYIDKHKSVYEMTPDNLPIDIKN